MAFVPDEPSPQGGKFVPDAGASLPPAQFSLADEIKKNPMLLTPWGLSARGMEESSKLVERGAYKAGGMAADAMAKLEELQNRAHPQKIDLPSLAPAVGFATNVAIQSAPTIAGAWLGSSSNPMARRMSERLMQSALKPTGKEMKTGRGMAAIRTALDDGYNASSGGVATLEKEVGKLEGKIQGTLNASPNTVSKGESYAPLQDLIKRLERIDPSGERAREVEELYTKVLANKKIPDNIPVAQANEIKQGIYQMLKDKYGTLGTEAVEGNKAIARGMKEAIGRVEPSVAEALKEQSAKANLLNIMSRRMNAEGNTNVASLAPLAAGPAGFIGFMMDKYGLTKSMAARLLNTAQQHGVPAAAGATTGAVMANQLGLDRRE